MRILIINLIYPCLVLSMFSLSGCRGEHPPEKQAAPMLPAVEVEAETVTSQEADSLIEVVGTVQPVNQAVIAAKITGTIDTIPVVLGSKVREGDLLVEISAGEISAKLNQARTQLEQAKRNLERERKLLEKDAATAENVRSLEEQYRIAQAAHDEARTMLEYTRITAPFAGVITGKPANVGDLATPGTPLLHLEDSSNLQVVASVPEALVLQIEEGNILQVHVPAAGIDLQGRVKEIAPAADPLSRTSTVKINIEEKERLRSGQFARVLLPGQGRQSLFVPVSAVREFGQMQRVYVIRGNTARLRLVRTGAEVGGKVEILSGIEPGEIIVTDTVQRLADGQPVTIKK